MMQGKDFVSLRLTKCEAKPSFIGNLYSFSLYGQLHGKVLDAALASLQQKFANAGIELSQSRIYSVHKGRAAKVGADEQAHADHPQTIIKVRVNRKDAANAHAVATRISKDGGVELALKQRIATRGPRRVKNPAFLGACYG